MQAHPTESSAKDVVLRKTILHTLHKLWAKVASFQKTNSKVAGQQAIALQPCSSVLKSLPSALALKGFPGSSCACFVISLMSYSHENIVESWVRIPALEYVFAPARRPDDESSRRMRPQKHVAQHLSVLTRPLGKFQPPLFG